MSISEINWPDRARKFCRERGSLEVANVEAAMREAAAVTVECVTERIAGVRTQLEAKRVKANAPQ